MNRWMKIWGHYLDVLTNALTNRKSDEQVVFYFLKDYDLHSLEFETIIEVDGRIEITLKEIDSDEGGNLI